MNAAPLGIHDLAVHVLEGFRHRREELLDGFLAGVDVGCRLGARFSKPRFGQGEKGLIVRLQRLGAQRLKRLAQVLFGLSVRFQALRMDGAIFLELGLKARLRRPRRKPADEDADTNADQKDQQRK